MYIYVCMCVCVYMFYLYSISCHQLLARVMYPSFSVCVCTLLSSAPPRIVRQSPGELRVFIGNELKLFVEAVGGLGDDLYYQWFCNGKKLNYGTSSEMYVKHAQLEDQGVYSCQVRSEHGGSSLSESTQVIGKWVAVVNTALPCVYSWVMVVAGSAPLDTCE